MESPGKCALRRSWLACVAAMAALVLPVGGAAAQAPPGDHITYRTLFQDPGEPPVQDLALERHAIALIDATPVGERITFAFRDFNRQPVADALIAAHRRGVDVHGVVDGDERTRGPVRMLLAALGPERFVICGTPDFVFASCIANVDPPSLQHNKFLTFSRLADGRHHVVLQTSKNFFGPSQLAYYNDMVEIERDVGLYDAYVRYLFELKAQVRTDDHYVIAWGDDGRNAIFTSPRRQPDRRTNDTIADRMDEIDCSDGGTIRAANMAFRSERSVIMERLIALRDAGCDVEVIFSTADADIVAGLVLARIPIHPFFIRGITGGRPQVIVHSKFWLVDAKNRATGARERITYAGSSNWRGDQQRSDDLLLRMRDDDVHAAYTAYWEKIRSRARSDLPRAGTDAEPPLSLAAVRPPANAAGWHDGPVTVRIVASDGHTMSARGLDRLTVSMTGAEQGAWTFTGEQSGYAVHELPVTAEGITTITHRAFDAAGLEGPERSVTVKIDRTPPVIRGLPRKCRLWPPNHRLVRVADVRAGDGTSGVRDLEITAESDAPHDKGDIVVDGARVFLRAEKNPRGRPRTYTITARATDVAGNRATATATCTVARRLRSP